MGNQPTSQLTQNTDLDALRAGHLLRNNSRVEVFDITPDEKANARKSQLLKTSMKTSLPTSLLRQVSNKIIAPNKTKDGKVSTQPCTHPTCERLTRRADGLCAKHAEETRAFDEFASDFSSQRSLYEAKIVGYNEKSEPAPNVSTTRRRISVDTNKMNTYTVYNVNVLHWNFEDNELYEWKLEKRYSQFDQLKKELVAAHGKLPAGVVFPAKITVGMSHTNKCLQRCDMLTKVLKGLIEWQVVPQKKTYTNTTVDARKETENMTKDWTYELRHMTNVNQAMERMVCQDGKLEYLEIRNQLEKQFNVKLSPKQRDTIKTKLSQRGEDGDDGNEFNVGSMSPILVKFLNIQNGRIDEMAQLGKTGKKEKKEKKEKIQHDHQEVQKSLRKTQSTWCSSSNTNATTNSANATTDATTIGTTIGTTAGDFATTTTDADLTRTTRANSTVVIAAAAASKERRLRESGGGGGSRGAGNKKHKMNVPTGTGHVIVTLGGPLTPNAAPGIWLKERIETGCSVYHRAVQENKKAQNTAQYLGHSSNGKNQIFMVVTGGDGGLGISEAEVCKRIMIDAHSVPKNKILTDCLAKDTIQNALLVVPLLIRLGISKVSIVTSEFHVRRTKHYFETIFAAYSCMFEVIYIACEDYMERTERSIRDKKETLLVSRSQGLLDQSVSEIQHEVSNVMGRRSWSFSLAKGSQDIFQMYK